MSVWKRHPIDKLLWLFLRKRSFVALLHGASSMPMHVEWAKMSWWLAPIHQIRSLAQAGKFRVAHSQASSITGKSRPPTRPGRGGSAAKSKFTSSQGRMQAAKKPSVQLPPDADDESTLKRRTGGNVPRVNENPLGQWYGPLPERSDTVRDTKQSFETATTGNLKGRSTFSPSSDEPKPEPGKIYDIHADTAPSLRPVPSEPQPEESTTYWADDADYKQAEDIRNSVQYSDNPVSPPVFSNFPGTPQATPRFEAQQQASNSVQGSIYKTTPLSQEPAGSSGARCGFVSLDGRSTALTIAQ